MGLCLGRPQMLPPNHFCANESLADPLEVLHQSSLSSHGLKCYSFGELNIATQKFSSHNTLLGVGSYGSVFRGWIDQKTLAPSKPGVGVVVAVKMFTRSLYGLDQDWESDAKCLELGQLQHTNLVRLIGYCLDSEKRFLVYEFMGNGNLGNHLFEGGEVMSWSIRMRIAVGVARGLSFLHSLSEHVVYREDLSTENILLDSDFNAKLSDFGHTHFSGYAKYLNLNHQRMWTIRKRFGSSPEQMLTGQTTQKSDVYGFGMVLLELLSGRKLWGEFAKLIRNSATPFVMIMDPKLLDVYPIEDAKVALTIAYQCVHSRPTTRPTMAHVLSELENLLN